MRELLQPVFGKSDADRGKEVRKAIAGSVRVCRRCHAVSTRKRWLLDPDRYRAALHGERPVEEMLCPGCERIDRGRIDGFVELRGGVLIERAAEVRNLIGHVLAGAREDDPVHQIASFTVLGDRIAIETTSPWLAETIGKAVQRQFHGDLSLLFSPGEDFVRVTWQQR